MEQLRRELERLLQEHDTDGSLRTQLRELVSAYPFGEVDYVLAHLLADGQIAIADYYRIRNEYVARNLYLPLFEMSPRRFGEVWAHEHLRQLVPALKKPSKKSDPAYAGEYDFWVDPGIRVEVKASRAVRFAEGVPIHQKALTSVSNEDFDMNFQQIKPSCCDVFVWLGVWRDAIKYWVIPSREVLRSPYYSKGQHRGNVGEGQLHINRQNVGEFNRFLARQTGLEPAIRSAAA